MSIRFAGRVLVACLVFVAGLGTAAASPAAAPTASVPDDALAQTDDGFLTGLQDTLEDIDSLLETVVDLVRTINNLTGEGGEGGE